MLKSSHNPLVLKPIINEKAMFLTKAGQYTFQVSKNSSKLEIAKIIEEKFNVDVVGVRTITLPSKEKTQPTRKGYYQTKKVKKAIVTVKKGQKIAAFETVAVEEPKVEVTRVDEEKNDKKVAKSTKKGEGTTK